MSNLIYTETQRSFWRKRHTERPEDTAQTTKVTSLLQSTIGSNQYYKNGLDLGCGNGRFLPLLSSICQHVWAVDIVPEVEQDVTARARNISMWIIKNELDGLPDGPHDFLFAAFLFQHLVDENVFRGMMNELRRVLARGARVIILDNAIDKAAHVKSRNPAVVASMLGLKRWDSKRVTVNNRPADHWWLEGFTE